MLREKNRIDQAFKEGLQDVELQPSHKVWAGIESRMDQKGRQRRMVLIWGMAAAASVLAAVLGTVSLIHPGTNVSSGPVVAEAGDREHGDRGQSYQVFDGNTEEKEHMSQDGSGIGDDTPTNGLGFMAGTAMGAGGVTAGRPTGTAEQHGEQPEKGFLAHVMDGEVAEGLTDALAKLTRKAIGRLEGVDVDASKLHLDDKKNYQPLYAYNAVKPVKPMHLVVGGAVSPAYSYGETSSTSVYTYSPHSYSESGISSIGGGVNIRMEGQSRWSFETGVVYAQIGQEMKRNSPVAPASIEMDGFSSSRVGPALSYRTSLGNVNMNKGSNVAGSEAQAINRNAMMVSADAIQQSLDFIEIPMMARYRLLEGFPIVSLTGGLSSNFLVDNDAYLVNGRSKVAVGETDGIKSFVLSSSLGLGLEMPVSKVVRISIEPRFKYFLDSVNGDPGFHFQPYSFSVFGGLTFVLP